MHDNGYDVILTTDRSLMSDYHGKFELGFSTSASPSYLPEYLFRMLFFPRMKIRGGIPVQAPYGLRKIESALVNAGIRTRTVDQRQLKGRGFESKIIGIHVIDPLALGPSLTWRSILSRGDPFAKKNFDRLMHDPGISRSRENGTKIIVGGPGAWQFEMEPDVLDRYGIDHVVIGQAELAAVDVVKGILNKEKLPRIYRVQDSQLPGPRHIHPIMNPSINGLVEVGRGCTRRCSFCEVSKGGFVWFPLSSIEKELKVNRSAGIRDGILHSDDIFLYGSKDFRPNEKRLIKLFRTTIKYYDRVGLTHASVASILATGELFPRISEYYLKNQDHISVQVGLETASPRLLKRTMPLKARPFDIDEWPNLVFNALDVMREARIIPYFSLISGLPGETREDTLETIELVKDLRNHRCLVIPIFFVPLGNLFNKAKRGAEGSTKEHKELLKVCTSHNMHWARDLGRRVTRTTSYGRLLYPFYYLFLNRLRRMLRKKGLLE